MTSLRIAAFLMAVFFLLTFAGAGYGFNIDRIAGLIGAIPGMVGLVGILIWGSSEQGRIAEHAHNDYLSRARRQKARMSRAGYPF